MVQMNSEKRYLFGRRKVEEKSVVKSGPTSLVPTSAKAKKLTFMQKVFSKYAPRSMERIVSIPSLALGQLQIMPDFHLRQFHQKVYAQGVAKFLK